MKKNKLKKISILLYSLLLVGSCTFVKAAGTEKKVSIQGTGEKIYVSGVHSAGNFYTFNLEGAMALCLNAGKVLHSGDVFVPISEQPITDSNIIKAYEYASSGGDRLAAQVVVWSSMQGNNNFALNISEAKKISIAEATNIWNQIQSKPGTTALYEWMKKDDSTGAYQDLITTTPGSPFISKCKMETYTNLATCVGNASSNTGLVYQRAVGTCSDNYVKETVNYSGISKDSNSYGGYCRLFCKESLEQEYPGNIAAPVSMGRYIVWPNNKEDTGNVFKDRTNLAVYPLKVSHEKTCKMYINVDESDIPGENAYEVYKSSYDAMKSEEAKYKDAYSDKGCSKINSEVSKKQKELDGIAPTIQTIVKGKSTTIPNPAWGAKNSELSTSKSRQSACKNFWQNYEKAKKVIEAVNTCSTSTVSLSLNSNFKFMVNYNDPEYGSTSFSVNKKTSGSTSGNNSLNAGYMNPEPYYKKPGVFKSEAQTIGKKIENTKINIKKTNTYDLNDDYYYYVDLLKKKSVNSLAEISGEKTEFRNYNYIGFSNLPISYNSKLGKQNNSNYYYDLKLKITEATGTAFDGILKNQDYTCHYEVTKSNDSCLCPPGTKHAGESLDCLIKEENSKGQYMYTCSDAQVILCDADNTYTEQKCDLACPNDPSMDLTACVNSGKSYNDCVNLWCSSGRKPVCPAGSNEGMDLSMCVYPMVNQGTSYEDALEYCVETTCPGKGLKIIYRTIKLENPFPSYNADDSFSTQKNLKIGMFNTNIKGRYPGSNWNSEKLVKTKIIKNRSSNGTKIYQTKEPLYVFELTPSRIKAIREYNDKNNYDDFRLSCNKTSGSLLGTACVSEFVHNIAYGLTGGDCSNVSNNKGFYNCTN